MRTISFDQLISKIHQYAEGSCRQDFPEIIWLDNVEGEISNITSTSDAPGLAAALAAKDDRVAFYYKAGSPLTDHKQRFDEHGNIVKVSDEERNSFCIPSPPIKIDKDGLLYTKLFIHSPYICYIGEDGITSLEFGLMLHERLNLSVLILYPFRWRDRIISKGSINGYNELLCTKQ